MVFKPICNLNFIREPWLFSVLKWRWAKSFKSKLSSWTRRWVWGFWNLPNHNSSGVSPSGHHHIYTYISYSGSTLLCITSDNFPSYYVIIRLTIIHHYLCQCQFNFNQSKYRGHEKAHFNLPFHTHVGGYGKGWNSS